MAFVLADRVKETCSAPGTGTATLLGAATGYQTFSAGIGANNTTYYTIADQGGANWEVGYGTIGAGGTTLARTTVLASSNSGSLVNFASGTQDVFCDYPAGKAVIADSANALRVDGQAYVNYESAPGTTVAAGRMWYDNTLGNWNLGMGGGNITQQIGEELFVYGKASSAITEGQLIMKTGVVGASGVITFAPTSANLTDDQVIIGLATENIPLNGFGRVTAFGVVHGIDTSAFIDGATVWYDPTSSAGGITSTKPTAPNVKCEIGIVINAGSGGSGSIQVEILHGTSLGGTDSNVNITSVANGNLLTYDGANTYWKNTDLTAGTGISVSKSVNGVLTVANTGVTSVTGTAPVVSSGGTTPAISMAAANGSTNGYLTSTDWTTFNNKGSGTVTSVGLSAPAIFTVGSSPVTGSGTISLTYSGTALPIANGGTNKTSYTAKSGNVAGLVFFDGTSLSNDTTVTDVGYDTSLNMLTAKNIESNNGIICNSRTVSSSFTIPSGDSAMSTGPITISSGVTVTVPSGGKWVVL